MSCELLYPYILYKSIFVLKSVVFFFKFTFSFKDLFSVFLCNHIIPSADACSIWPGSALYAKAPVMGD